MCIIEGGSNYEYFSGLRSKSGALIAINVWHASITAAGVRSLILATDMGGEFAGQDPGEMYARLGLASRLRTPGAHTEGKFRVHSSAFVPPRLVMRAGDVPPSLWEEACVWATDAHS